MTKKQIIKAFEQKNIDYNIQNKITKKHFEKWRIDEAYNAIYEYSDDHNAYLFLCSLNFAERYI